MIEFLVKLATFIGSFFGNSSIQIVIQYTMTITGENSNYYN